MPGIAVGDQKLELSSAALRQLADRLRTAPTIGERTTAAADAVIELYRLADGIERLEQAAKAIEAARAQAFVGVVEIFQPIECDCPSCTAMREEAQANKPRLN